MGTENWTLTDCVQGKCPTYWTISLYPYCFLTHESSLILHMPCVCCKSLGNTHSLVLSICIYYFGISLTDVKDLVVKSSHGCFRMTSSFISRTVKAFMNDIYWAIRMISFVSFSRSSLEQLLLLIITVKHFHSII